jgi:hypothetical protein
MSLCHPERKRGILPGRVRPIPKQDPSLALGMTKGGARVTGLTGRVPQGVKLNVMVTGGLVSLPPFAVPPSS